MATWTSGRQWTSSPRDALPIFETLHDSIPYVSGRSQCFRVKCERSHSRRSGDKSVYLKQGSLSTRKGGLILVSDASFSLQNREPVKDLLRFLVSNLNVLKGKGNEIWLRVDLKDWRSHTRNSEKRKTTYSRPLKAPLQGLVTVGRHDARTVQDPCSLRVPRARAHRGRQESVSSSLLSCLRLWGQHCLSLLRASRQGPGRSRLGPVHPSSVPTDP